MPEQLASLHSRGHNSPLTFVLSADCMDERPGLGVRELIIVFSFLCSGERRNLAITESYLAFRVTRLVLSAGYVVQQYQEQFVLRYRVAPQQFIPAFAEAALETPYFGPEPEPEP